MAFDLFTCVFLSGCPFLRYFFEKYASSHVIIQISYIFFNLKLGTEKHICLKLVLFLPWPIHT